jgi:hypothetical protein
MLAHSAQRISCQLEHCVNDRRLTVVSCLIMLITLYTGSAAACRALATLSAAADASLSWPATAVSCAPPAAAVLSVVTAPAAAPAVVVAVSPAAVVLGVDTVKLPLPCARRRAASSSTCTIVSSRVVLLRLTCAFISNNKLCVLAAVRKSKTPQCSNTMHCVSYCADSTAVTACMKRAEHNLATTNCMHSGCSVRYR